MKTDTHNRSTSIKFPRLAPAAFAAAALLTSAGAVNAAGEPWEKTAQAPVPAPQAAPASPGDSFKNEPESSSFFYIGAGAYNVSFSGDFAKQIELKSETLGGASFGGGYRFLKSKTGSFLLAGELGVYAGGKHETPLFEEDPPYDAFSGKMDFLIVPVSIIAAYEFNVAENFSLRAGAHLGVTLFSGDWTEKYYVQDFDGNFNNVDSVKDSFRQTAFSAGLIVGADYKLNQNWSIGLNYKFSYNSGVTFIEGTDKTSSTGHSFNILAAYSF